MKIQLVTPDAFLREIDWLYEIINAHFTDLSMTVTSHRIDLPRQPRRLGRVTSPFYLAADFRMVFDYARGQQTLAPDCVDDMIRTLARILFSTVADRHARRTPTFDWSLIKDRPLEVILHAAMGRARIDRGEWLNLDEVKALTGLSPGRVRALEIETKKIKGRVHCDPAGVLKILNR